MLQVTEKQKNKQIKSATKKMEKNGKNGNSKISHLSLESLIFSPYEKIKEDIYKKVGLMPKIPKGLMKGLWTEQAVKVLEERYLMKDNKGKIIETPEEMCWRVSWEIASADARWGKTRKEILAIAEDYYNLLIKHEFLPNSPTLMNAGTGNNLQYSACFVIPVEDSIEGIFDALKYQALIHKTGGGTGFSFSRLRPHGSMVKTSSGTASGPVSFMRIFDAATNEVKQGGKRRGANMGILRVDHPDILEFIHCKEEGGITNFNISVGITDIFMEAYKSGRDYELINPKTKEISGKLSAKLVFDEIVKGAWKTGDPGVIFIDRINVGSANPIPSLGPIESTNPCVTGETLISTDKGLQKIEDLAKDGFAHVLIDTRLGVRKFYPTKVFPTGTKEVYKLLTKEGYELRLTKDHRLMTNRGWKKAGELQDGDRILVSNRMGGFGLEGTEEEGQILGWLVGDGTMKASEAVLSFFGREKKILAPKFAKMVATLVDGTQMINRNYDLGVGWIDERDEARVGSERLWRYAFENGIGPHDKLNVPIRVLAGTKKMQAGFLSALFTADGHVEGSSDAGLSARLTSTSLFLLKDVQRLLLNFGIASKIYTERRNESYRSMPDGKGGKKDYLCKAYHDLCISKDNLWAFAKEIGFLVNYKNAKLIDALKNYSRGTYSEKYEASFEALTLLGSEKVYDLTEPMTHSFIANGFVVHNCGEQPLYPFDSCNLGSIFLNYFVCKDPETGSGSVDWEKLAEVTKKAVRFLDNVIEINPYTLPQIRQMTLAIRRIGLGVGGWADLLVELGIPYDSDEALSLAQELMSFVNEKAKEESYELAKERGSFPLWQESIYKNETLRRNSTVTTIAPTGTISIIAGASSGIEPLFAIAYEHIVRDRHLDRKLTFVNPKFEEVLRQKGVWSDEIKNKVAKEGVVRQIAEVPEDIKKVFGTAHEIDPIWHIKMQAAFQSYTENAVSKTINLRHDSKEDDVKNAYLLAWDLGCKGITVFRDGSKDIQVLNLGLNDKGKEVQSEPKEPLIARPFKISGSTYRILTPMGSAFITINENEKGEPIELFVNIGKAGSDLAAMAEALGRTISTTFRFRGDLPPKERAKEIALQLSGIGGRRSVGFGPAKILSLPDAVSIAISCHYGFKINGNGVLPSGTVSTVRATYHQETGASLDPAAVTISLSETHIGDICPSCGASALVYEEGCSKCHACGHSEC